MYTIITKTPFNNLHAQGSLKNSSACMVGAIAMTDSSGLNTTVETFSTVISFIVLADVMIAVIALVLLVVLVVMCRRMKKGR